MQDIVTGEVLGRRTNGHLTLEHLQPDFRPLPDRLEIDATVDERLSELSTAGSQGVGANGDWSRRIGGFEESQRFIRREELGKLVGEEFVVAIVLDDIGDELRHDLGP